LAYNLTGIIDNSTTILGFTQGVNSVLMQGWLGILILFGISIILFMAFVYSTNDPKKSFMATSFISFGLSIFLRAVNLVPDFALYITLTGAAIAIAFSFRKD